MNQGFKLRFDQMRESDPTGDEMAADNGAHESYTVSSHARNLGLIWVDGHKVFFNYAYLVAGEFEPNSDKNVIKLNFSSHDVTLQGYSLEPLFMALLDHLPRLIRAIDPRYVLDEDKFRPIVIEIIVDKKAD